MRQIRVGRAAIDTALPRFDPESEGRRYLELFDLAPGSYLETDEDGEILLANLATGDMLCARQSRIVGASLGAFVVNEHRGEFERSVARVNAGEEITGWNTRIQPATGPSIEVFVAVKRGWGMGSGGRVLRWLLHDVTQRKPNESQML